jgi:hypothetical protein
MANEFIARRGIISLDGAQITGSLSATGNISSNTLTVTNGITGTATSASYVEYSNVAGKPALVSGSSQISFNGITDKPTLVSGSSQITYSEISSIPSGIVSSSAQVGGYNIFATTGSNTFQANQIVTGSLFITQNLVVAGSSSIQYISSSVVDIADNIITVNAFNPGVRFGGLAVADSGSSPRVSGSILFDSIKDQWIFVHESSATTSSVILMGPETYNDLGNESYISANRLPKGSGVEHLRDSNISDTGTVVSINSNTLVTGSLGVTGSLTLTGVLSGTSGTFSQTDAVPLTVVRTSANSNIGIRYQNNTTSWYAGQSSDGAFAISFNTADLSSGQFKLTSAGAATFASSVAANSTIVQSSGEDGSAGPVMRLTSTNSNAGSRNWAIINTWDNYGDLTFRVSNSKDGNAVSAGSSKMVILSSGNVGIGLTVPQSILHLYTASSKDIPALGTAGGHQIIQTGAVIATCIGVNANGNYWIQPQRINDGGSNVYNILLAPSGGNVGIGTNSPTNSRLLVAGTHVSGNSILGVVPVGNQTATIGLYNSSSVRRGLFYSDTGFVRIESDADPIQLFAAGVNGLTVTTGGNVGIGITTPFSRLHVTNSDTLEGTIAIGNSLYPGLIYSNASSGEFRIDNRSSAGAGYITFFPNGQNTTLGSEAMRITTGGNVLIGETNPPVFSTPNGGKLLMLPNAVIVSGLIALGSPYTQNIQIDIVYNNWGGNNVIGLVDMIITLREYANTGGTAFGKVFAVNSGSGATFSSFNTTNVTTSQCTVTASSGGNYTLRITIDPSNVTDRGSFYLTIPNAGGTGSSISSITVSYV